MGGQHHHHHHHEEDKSLSNINMAFWLNTSFAVIELIGGIYTNSVAILSDALHDFGDSLSLGLARYFQKKSSKASDEYYSYGYKRFSLLGAFINAIILIIGSIFIIQEALSRLVKPEVADAKGMLILAFLGIIVNTLAMLRLRKGKSVNERVVSLHFIEDILGWVAVLIGSIVMLFADVPILDPILSILIAGYILFNVIKNLRHAIRIVLQGIPEDLDMEKIKKEILTIPGIISVHDLHSWTLDGLYNILTVHVVLQDQPSLAHMEKIKSDVRHCLLHYNIQHITIETETEGQGCGEIGQ